ncbi:dynactin subunit 3 [Camelus ferus]|nr:dynactin subunit 3 [Camelus ferus]
MAAVTDVQRLQARLEELEHWVYGPGGSRGSRKVADGLVKVQVALGNIASKRERVKILYKKIEDLIKYLDPEYIDRIAIPDASKLQFILAEEQFILSQVALLEQVEALVPMLDSTHIKAVPEHAARLQRLAQIHIQQQDQCVEITEESKALLEEYNKTLPPDTLEMRVRDGSKIRNLLGLALGRLEGGSARHVVFSGSGRAAGKAVSCAEIVKRRVPGLHQLTKLRFLQTEDSWVPTSPDTGLDPLTVRRHVPAVWVLLSRDPLDPNECGYQPPGAPPGLGPTPSSSCGPRPRRRARDSRF